MSQFIIEMGSGNTCRNDIGLVREMIDAVADVDTGKHEVIIKWQLFENQPPNEPLLWRTFAFAYGYAWERGYQTTSSVFDIPSLTFLDRFNVPFVKIANRPSLYWLARRAAFGRDVYLSFSDSPPYDVGAEVFMHCVSEYPAERGKYKKVGMFGACALSDHTVGWDLYREWQPDIIEKHFVLEHSDDNPDAGPFAATPEELAEVL